MDPGIIVAVAASVVSALTSAFSLSRARHQEERFIVTAERLRVLETIKVPEDIQRYVRMLVSRSPQAAILAACHEAERAYADALRRAPEVAAANRQMVEELAALREGIIRDQPTIEPAVAEHIANIASTAAQEMRTATSA